MYCCMLNMIKYGTSAICVASCDMTWKNVAGCACKGSGPIIWLVVACEEEEPNGWTIHLESTFGWLDGRPRTGIHGEMFVA